VTRTDTLVALEKVGLTDRDRLPLRFWFEASSVREAVDLVGQLRTTQDSAVQMRPGAQRLRSRCSWQVVVTTPSAAGAGRHRAPRAGDAGGGPPPRRLPLHRLDAVLDDGGGCAFRHLA
jgi:hypothetical protein